MNARRGTRSAVVMAFACACAVLPLLGSGVPPLIDMPNQVARLHIRAQLGAGGFYDAWYAPNSLLVPNAAWDLFGLALAGVAGPATLGLAFAVLAVLVTTSGAIGLARALGARGLLVPALAAAVAHNYATVYGLLNYSLGVGLALWATRGWLRCRHGGWPWACGYVALVALTLYACHLFAVLVFAALAGGIELRRARRRRIAALGLGLVPVALVALAGPAAAEGASLQWDGWRDVLRNVVKGLHAGTGSWEYVHGALLVVLAATLACTGRLRLAPRLFPGAVALAVVTLVCPDATAQASCLQQRLPAAVALVLVAALRWRPGRRLRWLAPALALALLGLRTAVLTVEFAARRAALEEAVQTLAPVPAGACVYTFLAASDDPWRRFREPLEHAACLLALEREVGLPQLLVSDYHHTLRALAGVPAELHHHFENHARLQSDAELSARLAEVVAVWTRAGRRAGDLWFFVAGAGAGLALPAELVETVAVGAGGVLLRARDGAAGRHR